MAWPWIIAAGVAAAAKLVYDVATDDTPSGGSSSTVSDEDERRQEATERRQKEAKQVALGNLKAAAVYQYERFASDTGVTLPLADLRQAPADLKKARLLVQEAIEAHCNSQWPNDQLLSVRRVEVNALHTECQRLHLEAIKGGL